MNDGGFKPPKPTRQNSQSLGSTDYDGMIPVVANDFPNVKTYLVVRYQPKRVCGFLCFSLIGCSQTICHIVCDRVNRIIEDIIRILFLDRSK